MLKFRSNFKSTPIGIGVTSPASTTFTSRRFTTESAEKPLKVKVKSLSHVRLFFIASPWTVPYQDPKSVGFSRQDWSGLLFPSPGDLLDLGLDPGSPAL